MYCVSFADTHPMAMGQFTREVVATKPKAQALRYHLRYPHLLPCHTLPITPDTEAAVVGVLLQAEGPADQDHGTALSRKNPTSNISSNMYERKLLMIKLGIGQSLLSS